MGENPSPSGEDFGKLAVPWRITARRRIGESISGLAGTLQRLPAMLPIKVIMKYIEEQSKMERDKDEDFKVNE